MDFKQFNLDDKLYKALSDLKYIKPTAVQEQSISHIMDKKDLIGLAQTGTGKTATFCLPILNSLLLSKTQSTPMHPKALILAPTRELCAQIGESIKQFAKYTDIKSLVTYGGVSSVPQIEALEEVQDILVATPGRLVDLVEQKNVFLDEVETFVLDEADNIIKMGFRVDLRKILKKLKKERQTLFFSATMNKEIKSTAKELLEKDFVTVEIKPEEIDLKLIEQKVMYVLKEHKVKTLVTLLKTKEVKRAIIFTNAKQTTDDIIRSLRKNDIKAEPLHSGKSNTHREKVMRRIQTKEAKILVATDLASRGLDFCDMTHIINYEIPRNFEIYVHRVGRVGRAGKAGIAVSLCCLDERIFFTNIEKKNKYPISILNHEFHSNLVKTNAKNKDAAKYCRPKPFKKKKTSSYSNRKGK